MSTLTARALVLEEPGKPPVVTQIGVLDPGPGEVRIKVAASGVCGTDGHAIEGTHPTRRLPVVLGHEGAGIVESVGPGVTGLVPGDHVVCALSVPCGTCRQCRRNMPEHCNGAERRQAISGVMADGTSRLRFQDAPAYPFFGVGSLAEYATVRQQQAVKIDEDLPLDEFCLTGCGVVTGVGAVLNVADVHVGDTVAVIGCGGVGINVIQAAKAAGATKIVAIDAIAEKLDLAKRVGATHGINARGDVAAELVAIEPEGVDVVFEVVGRPELMEASLSYTRVGGTAVMVGIPPFGSKFTFDAFSVNPNRRILGCRGGSVIAERDIGRLVAMYRSGSLDLGILVGQRLGLDSVFEAIDALGSSTFARSVVIF